MLPNWRFMARVGLRISLIGIAIGAVFYQFLYKSIILKDLGYNRVLEPLASFGIRCERIDDPGLVGCTNMWLHQESGLLYVACSDSMTRRTNPVNLSNRSLADRFGVLDIRNAALKNRLTWIQPQNFVGTASTELLVPKGFDILVDPDDKKKLHIIIVNEQSSGDVINQKLSSVIEYFTMTVGSSTMTHVRTFTSSAIEAPTHVTWVDESLFVFTNSHRAGGYSRQYKDLLLGGGSVGYCIPASGTCGIARSGNLKSPNGIAIGHDNLLYIPSAISGQIQVFAMEEQQRLRKVDTIQVPYPVNDISVDSNGDIYAATVPALHKFIGTSKTTEHKIPSAVFRIMKLGEMGEGEGWGWNVVKMMEDEGGMLPGITKAVHDTSNGKMFLGGLAPFVGVCEKKDGGVFSAQLQMLNMF